MWCTKDVDAIGSLLLRNPGGGLTLAGCSTNSPEPGEYVSTYLQAVVSPILCKNAGHHWPNYLFTGRYILARSCAFDFTRMHLVYSWKKHPFWQGEQCIPEFVTISCATFSTSWKQYDSILKTIWFHGFMSHNQKIAYQVSGCDTLKQHPSKDHLYPLQEEINVQRLISVTRVDLSKNLTNFVLVHFGPNNISWCKASFVSSWARRSGRNIRSGWVSVRTIYEATHLNWLLI
jgi:hypothetical protein